MFLKHRQYPGHLLCEKTLQDIPIEGPQGVDEDDPVNSDYNMKLTKFSFRIDRYRKLLFRFTLLFSFVCVCEADTKRFHLSLYRVDNFISLSTFLLGLMPHLLPFTVTDVGSVLSPRSWKAQLSLLNETIKSSKLEGSGHAPWYQDGSHPESPESGSCSARVSDGAFIPQDVTCSPCHFPQKGPARTSDPGRVWKRMHIREQEESLELACVSVTGFTALFTWAGERTGWTIVLWDLETQSTQCFLLGKKCIPVDSGGDRQLCLVLTGEDVF